MKLFPLRNRAALPASIVPQVRVGVAHLTGPGKLLATGEHLIYETAGARQVRLDTEGLSEIVAYGDVSLSGDAMRVVDRARIALSWLSPNGCFLWGRLVNDGSDRALTRLLQFQAWEDRAWQLGVARDIVSRKCDSIHAALRHYQRQGKSLPKGVLTRLEEHWHQGNFEQILERELRDWTASIRSSVSHSTSRAAAYLKTRLIRESESPDSEG